MLINKYSLIALIVILSFSGVGVIAGVSTEEAARLKSDLTPMGAERAGSADGIIPAWENKGVSVPEGYGGPGSHHPDPFPDDKPLFTITAANMDEYADRLTDGQKELLKIYPDTFRMPIFQTRRTATYPEFYAENTYSNAMSARVREDGVGVTGAHAGIPFPIPKRGIEVIWNHLLRYQGLFRTEYLAQFAPDSKGRYITDRAVIWQYFPYYDPKRKGDGILSLFRAVQLAPPRVAGAAYLFHDYIEPLSSPRNAWLYSSGQRRVRRAPTFVYDSPIPPSQGLRMIDEFDMYFGSPDLYEWKLLGKKSIFIPYNNYRLASPDLKYEQILTPGHINPDYVRYELHRVWVVEGNLKKGKRHIYRKRVKYLDEDSWNIVISDRYDKHGKIWRCAMSYLKTYWEVPLVYKTVEVHHDMISRRYNALPFMNEEAKTFDWSQPVPDDSFFTPGALRRSGVR